MNIHKASVAMAALALAFAGCTSSDSKQPKGNDLKPGANTGTVEFNLDLEDSSGNTVDTIEEIELNLMCTGVNQDHTLDVTDGAVVASFGGLEPGMCTVTLNATSETLGYDCEGSETFTIVAGDSIDVAVTLICVGENASAGGGVQVSTEFELNACADDRIHKIWAIPGNVLTGSSTTANAELQNLVGTPTITWGIGMADMDAQGEGSVGGMGTCDPMAQTCQVINCDGIGTSMAIDPATDLPVGSIWATLTVEDDECRDTERVLIDCLQASDCGDGIPEGAEDCDDGNMMNGDGCENDCTFTPACGNGTLNMGEECDPGLDGMQCIGCTDPGAQTCNPDCTIEPECGNGVPESGEGCDDGNLMDGDGCSSTCTTEAGVDACLECVTTLGTPIGDYTAGNDCDETGNPLCYDILVCMAESRCNFLSATNVVECFCGIGADINQCLTSASFDDMGACEAEILAANPPSTPRTTIAEGIATCNTPGLYGCAGNIMDLTSPPDQGGIACDSECNAAPAP